jgi:DNA-binding transcriptional ArsR family regulator
MVRTETVGNEGRDGINTLFACLANSDRRQLLGVLYDQAPHSLTRRDLASHLVHHGTPRNQESNGTVQQALVNLHHTHLPKLEAAGLLDQDMNQGTVTITDHTAFQDTGIVDVISAEANAESESLDSLFGALADARRRTILDSLSHQFHPIHTETLAREISAKEQGICESEVPKEEVKQVLGSLNHVHLPKLYNAGLIGYDADEQKVVYEGHSKLRVPWMHSVLGPNFRASLTGESEPHEMGKIEGREEVISYGQSLGERVEEELFCMFTHKDMLEAGCFARIMDAARRGVDVYIGTYDPTVREYVRENAPEIALWEPKTDWLNLPVEESRVGRLVLADREVVMLGTLKEKTEDGFPEEKAIIGEGTDNTLVVMIRQMLSPYLEQIDEQTEDIESHLPF